MDVLSDLIDTARVRGAVLGSVRARHPWGLDLAAEEDAAFHAVAAGSCWLRVPGTEPVQLMPGDVVLLTRGGRHAISSTPSAATTPYDSAAARREAAATGELVLGGDGPTTRFLCASYSYDRALHHPLLAGLPQVLHLPAAEAPLSTGVAASLRLMDTEIGSRDPGARAVVARMIDILFVQVLRGWLASDGGHTEPAIGWGAALRDRHIGAALALLHEEPARAWTAAELADAVHISRATLNRRFAELVGEAPMAYLTRWRMELAARQLRDGETSVAAAAHAVGYRSEFAFSRAFTRHHGTAPSRYRRTFAEVG
ncbi:AraC-type DNA-binding protein [Parafrankia irregularis]|uniref:AraC-type DNA-binding protein n=1 Tax=Parafrankia irregularis TaxID=795642 RepID=A0A0S4QUV0_9ACTN|nr:MULTISPECIES: AraC family transcriptional regulator [Parafrankia]MBE3203667.1 AraC family transcriptional regulator [Parafrankia sp. CH37]CUU59092.1 AraC-type DNA-binding protein [Parafrankia irregularis]